jgi:hypothetical protein
MLVTPFVELRSFGSQWCASMGFRLEELLRWRLRSDEPGERLKALAATYQQSTRLVEWIARMSGPVSVELHLVTSPSFDPDHRGAIQIALRLSTLASDPEQATAACLNHYVALRAALATFWPQALFVPLTEEGAFQRRFRPFSPRAGFVVGRRRAAVPLAEPFQWSPRPIGFTGQERSVSAPTTVDHLFPWAPAEAGWEPFLRMSLLWPAPQWVLVRLVAPVETDRYRQQLEATLHQCEKFLASLPADRVTLTTLVDQLRKLCVARLSALTQAAVGTGVFVLAPGAEDPLPASLLGQCLCRDPGDGQSASVFEGGFAVEGCDAERATQPFFLPATEPYTPGEAACAFCLPVVGGDRALGLPLRGSLTLPALLPASPATRELCPIALNRHRGEERMVRVPLAHRFKHVFLLGMTGTGKSTWMLSLLLRDLEAGHGVCLIDPHGELADEVLCRLPDSRERDLVLVDLADETASVPMNFLRWRTRRERDLIVDDLYRTMDRIYDLHETGGPIFERYFRGALRLLMGDHPEAEPCFTLLEVPMFFRSDDFRQYLIRRTQDAQLEDFVEEAEAVSGDHSLRNLAPYITSKFTRFLQDELLRRIVGHGDMRLDWQQILNEQKVLLLKLGRGRFGGEAAEMLLGLLMSRFRCAVMGRAALPADQRRPFFLYVDEIGSLGRDPNFSQLLSEARKYRVGLVVATQYGRQLNEGRGANLLSAVLGNAGSVLCFRVGVEDAPILAPLFAPAVQAEDLVELPNFEAYMRLHLDQAVAPAFSIVTERPRQVENPERAVRLVEQSRQQWAVSPEECDSRARLRRRFIEKL